MANDPFFKRPEDPFASLETLDPFLKAPRDPFVFEPSKPEEHKFIKGFTYGMTGLPFGDEAYTSGWGRGFGEMAGLVGTAIAMGAARTHPLAQAGLSYLRGLKGMGKVAGAHKAATMASSQAGRSILQKMGFSPSRAARISKVTADNLSLEMAFQTGKAGLGYLSGMEEMPVGSKMSEIGLYMALTGAIVPPMEMAAPHVMNQLRKWFPSIPTPKHVQMENLEGRIVPTEETAIAKEVPEIKDPDNELTRLLRAQEFGKQQWESISEHARRILERSGLSSPADEIDDLVELLDDSLPQTAFPSAQNTTDIHPWRTDPSAEIVKESKRIFNDSLDDSLRILRLNFVGKSSNLESHLEEMVKRGEMTAEQADDILSDYLQQIHMASVMDAKYADLKNEIWNKIPIEEYDDFDQLMAASFSLDGAGRNPPVAGAVPPEEAAKTLARFEEAAAGGNRDAAMLLMARDKYLAFMKAEIDEPLIAEGILPDEAIYDNFLPTRKLADGTFVVDTRKLAAEAIGTAQKKLEFNRMAKNFAHMAEGNPENGIASWAKGGGDTWELPPPGYRQITYHERKEFPDLGVSEPVVRKINIHQEIWKDIQEQDPALSALASRFLGWASLSTPTKKFLVEWDPGFALVANPPMDILQQWLTDFGKQRSSFLPTFAKEMAEDIKAVWRDAKNEKGAIVESFVRNGGEYRRLLHGESREIPVKKEDWVAQAAMGETKMPKPLKKLAEWASYSLRKSEILLRLAAYRRYMKNYADNNGVTLEDALKNKEAARRGANFANNYMDLANDARIVRTVDSFVPFYQAHVSLLRPQVKAMRKDPKLYAWKASQLMSLGVAMYLANKAMNGEEYDKLSAFRKANSYVLMTPFTKTNEKGQKQSYYVKFPKDGTTAPFVSMGEALVKRMVEGEIPSDELRESWSQHLNLINPKRLLGNPALQAYLAYFQNKDYWLNDEIWPSYKPVMPEDEIKRSTSRLAESVGGTTGLSPERLETATEKITGRNNPFLNMLGFGYKTIADAIGEDEVEKDWFMNDAIRRMPMANRMLGVTPLSPSEPWEIAEEVEKREGSWKEERNRMLDRLMLGETTGHYTREDIENFIKQQPPNEQRRLRNRLRFKTKTNNLLNTHLLGRLAMLPKDALPEAAHRIYQSLETPGQKANFLREIPMYPGLVKNQIKFWDEFNHYEAQTSGRGYSRLAPYE